MNESGFIAPSGEKSKPPLNMRPMEGVEALELEPLEGEKAFAKVEKASAKPNFGEGPEAMKTADEILKAQEMLATFESQLAAAEAELALVHKEEGELFALLKEATTPEDAKVETLTKLLDVQKRLEESGQIADSKRKLVATSKEAFQKKFGPRNTDTLH